jgi:stringent starvation protein B
MPQDVIDRVAVLARQNPVGMNFTNMQNKAKHDIDDDDNLDSDNDSDHDSDNDNDEDDDDDYDDFIA